MYGRVKTRLAGLVEHLNHHIDKAIQTQLPKLKGMVVSWDGDFMIQRRMIDGAAITK